MDNFERRLEEVRRVNANLEEGIASNAQEMEDLVKKILEEKAREEEEKARREAERKQRNGS